MPTTQKKRATKAQDKDLITRLADAGEDAIQRLGDLPGGKTMVEAAQTFRSRLDELAVRIRAIDPLEKRVTALEKRLATLERKEKPAADHPADKDELEPGTRSRRAFGTTSNFTGVVPGCSPSSSTGRGTSASTDTTLPRSSSAFGCGR